MNRLTAFTCIDCIAGDLNKLADGQRGYSDSTIYQKASKEELDEEVRSAGQLGQVGPGVRGQGTRVGQHSFKLFFLCK